MLSFFSGLWSQIVSAIGQIARFLAEHVRYKREVKVDAYNAKRRKWLEDWSDAVGRKDSDRLVALLRERELLDLEAGRSKSRLPAGRGPHFTPRGGPGGPV